MDNEKVYYDEATNSVMWNGSLNPINPDTDTYWDNRQEAEDWIAALPEPTLPFNLTLVTAEVRQQSGDVVEIQLPYNLVVLTEGDTIDIDVEVQDGNGNLLTHYLDGNGDPQVIPDATFTLPIIGLFGSAMKVVDVNVSGGVATITTQFNAQGMWQVTEAEVNMHIAEEEKQFTFTGLQFKVKEAVL